MSKISNIPPVPNVLVVAAEFTDSFMKDDLRILHRFVNAVPFEFWRWRWRKGKLWGITRAAYNILLFIYLLFRLDVQAVIFWFAATNYAPLLGALTKLFGRKVLVITGGIDAVYVADIDWGAMKSKWHRINFSILMRLADSVLPFSSAVMEIILESSKPRKIRTAYPPVDTGFFTPNFTLMQPRIVTCCYQYDSQTIIQKGLDVFVQVARQVPDYEFVVIGNAIDDKAQSFQKDASSNVRFISRIPTRSGYRDFLQTCSVYAQLSVHEGFGVSLAEAMACGCTPVVSDKYALPEVVGEYGFVIPYGDTQATVQAIFQALATTKPFRESIRTHVVDCFDRNLRHKLFLEELLLLVPTLAQSLPIVRIELGCGSVGEAGTIGVDLRRTVQTKAVCDVRRTCFQTGIADEVYSICVLEHLDNPYELLDEVIRLLKPNGRAILRVPNIGTYSAHLDLTHRFLADLGIWKSIMKGYFEQVQIIPVGTKYRDNFLLREINAFLIKFFGFYELAQGWTFVCSRKKAHPIQAYVGWWADLDQDR